jgi:uncharacterized protein YjbI with pentapeptide repeats
LSDANLSGADLNGTDLRGADLRGANLDGATLVNTDLDFKVYQFFLGKRNAVATPDYLQIGCKQFTWEEWDKSYKEVGREAEFTEAEIRLHRKQMTLLAKEFKVGKYKVK